MVWLIDEAGNSFRAEVIEVGRRQTRLLVLDQEEPSTAKIRLILAQSLIKSKNMDLVIQKATELGVQMIIPVETSRAVLKLEGREKARLERWRKIAREAAKQSRRTDIPMIHSPESFSEFLDSRAEPIKFVLCEDGGIFLGDILAGAPGLKSASAGMPEIVLLVGPEGGWSEEEKQQAIGKGFEAVSLGKRILRSETASLAALAAIQIFWGG
jgi:16S rRNA (uracil1498-N3)-methyltransferase